MRPVRDERAARAPSGQLFCVRRAPSWAADNSLQSVGATMRDEPQRDEAPRARFADETAGDAADEAPQPKRRRSLARPTVPLSFRRLRKGQLSRVEVAGLRAEDRGVRRAAMEACWTSLMRNAAASSPAAVSAWSDAARYTATVPSRCSRAQRGAGVSLIVLSKFRRNSGGYPDGWLQAPSIARARSSSPR